MTDAWPGTPVSEGAASADSGGWPGTPVQKTETKKPGRGTVDQLLGLTGPRYQTFPERAVRDLLSLPEKTMTAAASATPGSHEFSEAVVPVATETAFAASPASAGMRAARAATGVAAPEVAEIAGASKAAYEGARGLGVKFKPEAVQSLVDDVTKELTDAGYRDYLAPKTFRAIQELKAIKNPTYSDVESVRQLLNRAGADPMEKDAVRRAIEGLDDFVGGLGKQHVLAGEPEALAQLSQQARGNWSVKKRVETIQDALDKAERQAGSAHSGANTDNAIRQQIKSIRNNPKKSRGFTEDELALMDEIITGSTMGNLLRTGGNLLGGGGGLGAALTAGGGALVGGPLGAMAAPLAGYGLKQAGGATTRRQVEQLMEMIRRRSPEAESRGATEMRTPSRVSPEFYAAPARGAAGLLNASPLAPNEL
jgi:hypothetical protein